MRKPIFRVKWSNGKKPLLQINILKQIALEDQLSKRKIADILNSNYPVISDAVDALLDEKKFIEFSHETGRRNPEKFYKITENGLRALLEIELLEREFWKVIILLCIRSKRQIGYDEFEEYYHRFREKRMGHSAINQYFFQLSFFDHILDNWLLQESTTIHSSSVISLAQKVMECLALNRSITLQQLAEKTSTNKEVLIKVLNNYTLQYDIPSNTFAPELESIDLDIQRNIYFDFIRRALIISNRTNTKITYELSLFGIMLVIALIRYHYVGIDSARYPNIEEAEDDDTAISRSTLFYTNITQEEYYNRIAYNYKEKLPLIFEKWDFLKEQLGSILLYDSFDFMIYKKASSNSTLKSIWIGGNKEFYEDIQSLADNARHYLSLMYISGVTALQNFQNHHDIINDSRINPIYQKLAEIEEILKYINITSFLYELHGRTRSNNLSSFTKIVEQRSSNKDKVQTIEKIFSDELTFLFYLNLNTISFQMNKSDLKDLAKNPEKFAITKPIYQDIYQLGTPEQRLMAILSKDNDIKSWFSERIADITSYRKNTLDKMSKFYSDIINSHQNIRTTPEKSDNGALKALLEMF